MKFHCPCTHTQTAIVAQEGVAKSDVFVLFCTKGVFTRPYVQLEILEALNLGKPFILIHEADEGKDCKFEFDKCARSMELQPQCGSAVRACAATLRFSGRSVSAHMT
jgi:hypothetical protein